MRNKLWILLLPIVLSQAFSLISSFHLQAQTQDFDFSANNPECVAYQCLGADGNVDSSIKPQWEDSGDGSARGKCICPTGLAVLKPPKLQQLQIWFYRVLYAIWGFVAGFSFLTLVYLGYRYMLRGGTSDTELVKLRKDILNYVIGFALVFLAVPILSTIFRLMQINDNVACYQVSMPGFQFFFEDLCTDPQGNLVEGILKNPCDSDDAEGKLCDEYNVSKACPIDGSQNRCYWWVCSESLSSGHGTWQKTKEASCDIEE
jgi:hypothetical protein